MRGKKKGYKINPSKIRNRARILKLLDAIKKNNMYAIISIAYKVKNK